MNWAMNGILMVIIGAVLLPLAGCGKKADPLPPLGYEQPGAGNDKPAATSAD